MVVTQTYSYANIHQGSVLKIHQLDTLNQQTVFFSFNHPAEVFTSPSIPSQPASGASPALGGWWRGKALTRGGCLAPRPQLALLPPFPSRVGILKLVEEGPSG